MLQSYQTLLQGVQVVLHLPQQQLQFAARHVKLLLGLVALLCALLRLELTPQSLEGGLLSLPALQLLLQVLQTTNIRDGNGASLEEVNICSYVFLCAYSECVAVLLQSSDRCVWVTDVHCVTSAVCMCQPQQQRVEGFMELL